MKDIAGYEGLYAITSCGRVWSYISNKFLKTFDDKDGYKCVKLYTNKSNKCFKTYRLVAEAYIPNPDNLPEVNHIDENKDHNYINNLEWCSHNYNNNYGTRNKRMAKNKMKYKKIRCIENNKIYDNYDDISNDLNIKRSYLATDMVKCIKNNKSLSGYHFEEVI